MKVVDQASLRQQEAAKRVGREVGEAKLSLRSLKEDGVLVSCSVRGLSICSHRTPNSLRGLTDNDVRRKRLTPGVTKVIPIEELSSLEAVQAQVHSVLAMHGYSDFGFGRTGGARFITWRQWNDWYTRHAELEARWAEIVDRVCEKLPAYRDESVSYFELLAVKGWKSIWSNHFDEDSMIVDGIEYSYSNAEFSRFENSVVTEAIARIPTEERILESLRIEWYPRVIRTAEDIEAEVLRLEAERNERAMAAEEAAVREIVAAKLNEQLATMADPRDSMMMELRGRMADIAERTRDSIEAKDRLYRPTSEALANMRDTFRKMDLGDGDLGDLIDELHNNMESKTDKGRYNVNAIAATLRKIERLRNQDIAQRNVSGAAARRIGALEF